MKLDDLLATDALIPSLPQRVTQILLALQQDEPDMRHVNELLAGEVGMTVRILRLVNSVGYSGGGQRISSVEAATALLGMKATRQLVSMAAVGGAFRQVPGVDLTEFWRYSLDVAKIAESLAAELAMDKRAAFTAGLLHGTGDLIMKMAMPKQPSLQLALQTDSERHAKQIAELGYSFAEVGAAFTERWLFPEAIADAIRHHCDPQCGGDSETLASVLYLATWSACAHELDMDDTALFDAFPQEVADKLGLADTERLCSDEAIVWTLPEEARDFS